MRKWLFFTFVAFVMALIHACSLNNSIIKPNCQVFQIEMVEKWWVPNNEPTSTPDKIYFQSNGTMKKYADTDSISYELQNCNSLVMHNANTGETKQWVIKDLNPDRLVLEQDNNSTVTYVPFKQ